MLTPEVDEFFRCLGASKCRLLHGLSVPDEGDDGSVMVGIRFDIEQFDAGNGLDGGDDLVDDISPPPLAEIGDALYDLSHDGTTIPVHQHSL
jgi:hypothetical protein